MGKNSKKGKLTTFDQGKYSKEAMDGSIKVIVKKILESYNTPAKNKERQQMNIRDVSDCFSSHYSHLEEDGNKWKLDIIVKPFHNVFSDDKIDDLPRQIKCSLGKNKHFKDFKSYITDVKVRVQFSPKVDCSKVRSLADKLGCEHQVLLKAPMQEDGGSSEEIIYGYVLRYNVDEYLKKIACETLGVARDKLSEFSTLQSTARTIGELSAKYIRAPVDNFKKNTKDLINSRVLDMVDSLIDLDPSLNKNEGRLRVEVESFRQNIEKLPSDEINFLKIVSFREQLNSVNELAKEHESLLKDFNKKEFDWYNEVIKPLKIIFEHFTPPEITEIFSQGFYDTSKQFLPEWEDIYVQIKEYIASALNDIEHKKYICKELEPIVADVLKRIEKDILAAQKEEILQKKIRIKSEKETQEVSLASRGSSSMFSEDNYSDSSHAKNCASDYRKSAAVKLEKSEDRQSARSARHDGSSLYDGCKHVQKLAEVETPSIKWYLKKGSSLSIELRADVEGNMYPLEPLANCFITSATHSEKIDVSSFMDALKGGIIIGLASERKPGIKLYFQAKWCSVKPGRGDGDRLICIRLEVNVGNKKQYLYVPNEVIAHDRYSQLLSDTRRQKVMVETFTKNYEIARSMVVQCEESANSSSLVARPL